MRLHLYIVGARQLTLLMAASKAPPDGMDPWHIPITCVMPLPCRLPLPWEPAYHRLQIATAGALDDDLGPGGVARREAAAAAAAKAKLDGKLTAQLDLDDGSDWSTARLWTAKQLSLLVRGSMKGAAWLAFCLTMLAAVPFLDLAMMGG